MPCFLFISNSGLLIFCGKHKIKDTLMCSPPIWIILILILIIYCTIIQIFYVTVFCSLRNMIQIYILLDCIFIFEVRGDIIIVPINYRFAYSYKLKFLKNFFFVHNYYYLVRGDFLMNNNWIIINRFDIV